MSQWIPSGWLPALVGAAILLLLGALPLHAAGATPPPAEVDDGSALANGAAATSPELLNIRDPFKRPASIMSALEPKSELELIPIEQFKLIGVVTGPERLKAMLVAGEGKTYFVSVNTKLGMRKGVIRKITPESVLVRERIVNVLGQEEDVDTELKLAPSAAR